MSVEGKCPECKVGTIVEDTIGTESNKICKECGYVIKSSALQEETFVFQEGYTLSTAGGFEKKYRVNVDESRTVRKSKLYEEMMRKIQNYTEEFPNSEGLYEASSAMYTRVCENSYHYNQKAIKNLVAAACLILVLRQNGHEVLTHQVCQKLGIPIKGLSTVLAEVKKHEQTKCPLVSMESVVDGILRDYIPLEEQKQLRRTAVQLCQLFEELQISTSRHKKVVASGALYLAFLSEGTTRKRRLKLTDFCKKYKMEEPAVLKTFMRIAWDRLSVLANRLPWADKPVKKMNVHLFIKDIIKSKLALKSRDADPENRPVEKRQKLSGGSEAGCSATEHRTSHEYTAVVITDQMKLDLPPRSIQTLREDKKEETQVDPTNVSYSETICEKEFTDDISEYIRSAEEVAVLTKIKELVGVEDNSSDK